MVPVAPEIGCLAGYHDDVSRPRWDLLLAARTEVGLHRLIGLHAANHLAGYRGISAHSNIPTTTATANATIT
jgi:hypothetical protein